MTTTSVTKKPLTFRPDPAIKERLEHLAHETNRSVSFYINRLLEEHLNEMEYAYLLKQEAEDIRSGKVKARSMAEVRQEMGF